MGQGQEIHARKLVGQFMQTVSIPCIVFPFIFVQYLCFLLGWFVFFWFLFLFFLACLLYYWSCMVLISNQISPYSTLQNHMATCEESPYLNGLFVFSGRMGAPSELSPWFGVHG